MLPTTLSALSRLLSDDSAVVVKRAILTACTIYGLAFATMYGAAQRLGGVAPSLV